MNENILVVEDEEAMRVAVSDRLRREGYAVDCAADGETGFQKATSLAFDLMIFDITLPHRSGFDLCRDVRSAGLETPILLLSAYHQTVIKTTGFEVGADDYVSKPFDMLELNARVRALLRRSKSGTRKDLPQPFSMQAAEEQPPKVASQGLVRSPMTSGDGKLEDEVEQIAAQKDFSRLAKVIPRLRNRLAQEMQSPQTPGNAGWLGVAEGIIEFLEEVFQGREPRRVPIFKRIGRTL
jgi:CheY-like chemotaxis protein